MTEQLASRLLADGIEEIDIDSEWVDDLPVLRDVLERHFGSAVAGSRLTPSPQPDELRAALLNRSARLADLVERLQGVLLGDASAVVVRKMHLDHLDVDDRGVLLYCLAAGMGYPTGADPRRNQVVWPVTASARSREFEAARPELDFEAEYHTDSQYHPDPERYFLLYAVRAARCGGGDNRVRANAHITEFLAGTPEGRKAMRVLEALDVPFRIPSDYADSGEAPEKRYTFAPILAERNTLRWRRDTVEKGLAELPEYDHPDLRDALGMLESALAEAPHEVRLTLVDDSFIVVDNHRAVHARTEFADLDRHHLGIRFHDTQHVR
ncbi:TauD/TfdA family dioxygenase [Streptomyces sp. NPDC059152]|uniref:TauD/TfdA family dioxygenase n=1 Tax=Streptomyces sp. NPDC059152 TaxID=3346742 RepID=UPI00369A98E4